jgi:ACS family glucarate transporter-like MFS transporter
LADRIGARKVLMWASGFWVATTVIQAAVGRGLLQTATVSATVTIFLVCRFLLGIAEAPTYTAAGQGVSRWVLRRFQGRSNGIVIASIGLGSALAPPLVSNVMIHWGWRAGILISALPALITTLIWLRLPEPPAANPATELRKNTEPAPGTNNLRTSSFVLLTLSYTLQGYVGYIFVSWFYLYLVQERHFGLLGGAWMSSLPWILSIVSIPLGGLISDRLSMGSFGQRWGRRFVPILGMALSGVLISIGAHTDSAVIAAISLAFATAFVLCVEGPFWTMMMTIAGPRSGSAGGIMNMGSNVGGLISPALTPVLAGYIGWENALHVAAGLAVLAALLWLGIGEPQEGGPAIERIG